MSMTAAVEHVVPDVQWHLTDYARYQLEECAIAYSELYRLLRKPDIRMPAADGTFRYNGYGLSAITDGQRIVSVQLDGASSSNWEGWARERAEFGDSDVNSADALVAAEAARLARTVPEQTRRRGSRGKSRRLRPEARSGPVRVRSIPVEPVERPALRPLAPPPARPKPTPTPLPVPTPAPAVPSAPAFTRVPVVRATPAPSVTTTRPRIGAIPPVREPEAPSVDILNLVHPALRDEVERQVMTFAGGDFSRLVITSPTKVTIAPL